MTTVIGVVGEAGSGKSEVARSFESLGCARISLSDVLRDIASNIGLSHSRQDLINLGNALREQFGPEILAWGIENKIMQAETEFVVVESIRNPEELRYLREKYQSLMIGVVMDEKKKFELMLERGREGDPKTWEDYQVFRLGELVGDQSVNGIKIQECLDACDVLVENNTSLELLKEKVCELHQEIKGRRPERL